MFMLKGGDDKTNPTKGDLEAEIAKLQNDKIEFITLEKNKEEFIQVLIPNYENTDDFYIEIHLKDKSWRTKNNIKHPKLLNFLSDFTENKLDIENEKNLEMFDVYTRTNSGTSKKNIFAVFFFITIVISGGAIFSAIQSNMPWYDALPSAGAAMAVIFGFILIKPFLFSIFIPKILEKISNIIKMPCTVVHSYGGSGYINSGYISSGYSIKVKDKKTHSSLKLFFLFIVELFLIFLSVICLLLWLTIVVFLYWYITDTENFMSEYENLINIYEKLDFSKIFQYIKATIKVLMKR